MKQPAMVEKKSGMNQTQFDFDAARELTKKE